MVSTSPVEIHRTTLAGHECTDDCWRCAANYLDLYDHIRLLWNGGAIRKHGNGYPQYQRHQVIDIARQHRKVSRPHPSNAPVKPDQLENWRATNPRTGGRPARELAGDQPENWRATNPRTGGRPRAIPLSAPPYAQGAPHLSPWRLALRAPGVPLSPCGVCLGRLGAASAGAGCSNLFH